MSDQTAPPAYRWLTGRGGWVRVDVDAVPGPLWLRLRCDQGRWFVSEFYLDGRGAEITAGTLRALAGFPAAVVGTLIDGGTEGTRFAHRADQPGPDLSRLAGYALTPDLRRWAPRLVRLGQAGWALDSLRAQIPAQRQQEIFGEVIDQAPEFPDPRTGPQMDEDDELPPPPPPAGGRIDEDFLRSVAGYYRWAVGHRLRPGPEIARASQVSLRTAQNWVYLARKCGALAPTKPGRVG
jgi:hypothetical protein